jgi:hypothetical protein
VKGGGVVGTVVVVVPVEEGGGVANSCCIASIKWGNTAPTALLSFIAVEGVVDMMGDGVVVWLTIN